MKPVQKMLLCASAWMLLTGCSAPQNEYKPLYQAQPEKEELTDEVASFEKAPEAPSQEEAAVLQTERPGSRQRGFH